MRETLDTQRRRAQSNSHPSTLFSLDEAEALFREALAGFQLALGAAHASTRNTAANLEAVLRAKAAAAQRGARRA